MTDQEISPLNDAEWLAQGFSEIFAAEAVLPDYRVTGDSYRHSKWVCVELEDAVKNPKAFLPHARCPEQIKKNIFFKAQRVAQGMLCSQLLAKLYSAKISSKSLYFKGKLVTAVYIQWLTIKGHRDIFVEDWEDFIVKREVITQIIKLDVEGRDPVYIDVCSPQVDVFSYGPNGFPYLMLEKLEEKKDYAPEVTKMGATVYSIEEPILVKNETNWNAFLKKMEIDFDEEVRLYCEYVDEEFKKNLKTKQNTQKKKKQKANQKAKKLSEENQEKDE